MKILLIEDDPVLNQNITEALTAENFNVIALFDGSLMERKTKNEAFDCIIMDVNLPGKNGFELCRDFRSYNKSTPVIMLTAFGDLEDKVTGFNCGADDYLTKPFYMRELIIRVQNLIKQRASQHRNDQSGKIYFDDILIDTAKKQVFRQNKEVALTPREFNILLKLVQNPCEVISKKDLVRSIWGDAMNFNTNTIEVYINFLRNKLDKPFGKNTIRTKIGYGYYLEAE